MLFNYKAIENSGENKEGTIEAINIDIAISSLQKRGLMISSILPVKKPLSLNTVFSFWSSVSTKEIVVISRQVATLFEAQVSALRVFRLIASEEKNLIVQKSINEVADDIQGGSTISKALSKHPFIFSSFYVNMVRAGEESGKLDQTFSYLADYLERNYDVTSKAKSALIYPAFVISTFVLVMIFMFTFIIPKISGILVETGQELPFYTRIVLNLSTFFVLYGFFFLAILVVAGFFLWKYIQTPEGKLSFDIFKLEVPYVGTLYRKLYLSRIADNTSTLLSSGVSMLKALEITALVVGNEVYKDILEKSVVSVRGGKALSVAFSEYPDIPPIMVQMVKVGEETGELGNILKTLSKFYQKEVVRAVDTLIDLIEPAMIIILGVAVGILIASILVPIYNITSAF
ncbi:MAG: type II secretion system F family protein [Parcubacteria group bacterium]|nr:type II secretion system F family protein [Parcubacteria group bacterium]